MAYPPKIEQLSYNWWTERGGQAIVAIIAHGTVGTDSRAYLSRGGDLPDGSDKKVSIHALIQKTGDPIYRYVPDERGANHAGYGTMPAPWTAINPNKCTLGFELENLQNGSDPYPDAQLLAMGWLINQWRAKWGPLPIYRHTDIDPPPRKYDTVNLTVAQIEEWAARAAQQSGADPWPARWGPIAPPDQTSWQWDIPVCWKQHWQLLGQCISSALYDNPHGVVVQCFEGGDVRQRAGHAAEATFR